MIQIPHVLATVVANNIPSTRATITRMTLSLVDIARAQPFPSRSQLENQASYLGDHLSATLDGQMLIDREARKG